MRQAPVCMQTGSQSCRWWLPCYSKIAKLPLCLFDRAHVPAAYGVTRILHHAEHNVMPAEFAHQPQR